MKLEKQVCSLELAQRLKILGVKQESHFKWNIAHPEKAETDSEELALKGIQPQLADADWATDDGKLEDIAAFTVAELGEMLPARITSSFQPCTTIKRQGGGYTVTYVKGAEKQTADTEADARAKMLIYLIENKLITV